MPRFAANLSLLFCEYPPIKRFAAAKLAGFNYVEMLFPYELDQARAKQEIERNDLTLVLINTAAGDWNAGERGFAAVPGAQDRFREEFEQALQWAHALNAQFVHVMAGIAQGEEAQMIYIENLRWAAEQTSTQQLTIEPINPIDMPGYFLNNFSQAMDILKSVNAPNLHLQFDAYHAHRIAGNVLNAWQNYGNFAAHIQVAGAEGRHEPVNGAIDYHAFFEQLDREQYAGVVCGEYFPKGRTEDGLGWIHSTG
ncbi:Putative hydroxypyruvate isomerase YgbM [Roseovarius albus]|uniref:Putative hydroxypyruvate isomerase YgbM n=2 Tax=Roseovarius albus TaxID=1247867 RepID=A0A1X6ZR89_9RHOB|nr:Putative hydroxypyruvate isomerase YgbM [Roseovarius albus]